MILPESTVVALCTLAVITLGISILCVAVGVWALIELRSFNKSTHQVQYMPIDPDIDKENEKLLNEWATSEKSIEKQNKLFKEDLEETMPEFLDDDERYTF